MSRKSQRMATILSCSTTLLLTRWPDSCGHVACSGPIRKLRKIFLVNSAHYKVQSFGNQKLYSEHGTFRPSVKKLLCVAFLPDDDVDAGLQKLRKENTNKNFKRLADYFEDTYVGAWREAEKLDRSSKLTNGISIQGFWAKRPEQTMPLKDGMAASTSLWQRSTRPFQS